MELEHTIPEAPGGLTEEDNLWLACALCNHHTGDCSAALDPVTGEVIRLFDPRHQQWHDHVAWSEDGVRVISLGAIGRATVAA